jgi:phage terminase small subunit
LGGGTIGIAYGVTQKKGGVSMLKLTPKQESFAKSIALEGMSYVDAYRNSYSVKSMSDDAIYVGASNLANNPKISLRIKELAAEADSPKIMNAIKRKERLTQFASSEDANVAMKAIDLLNKMDGEYVQKVEAEVKNAVNISIELSDD